MDADPRYETWAEDAHVLAEIGRHLFSQPTRITVRMPRALADRAVSAWERDEATLPLAPESPEQAALRDQAATLALIGLSIEDRSHVEGDDIVVDLGAWFIGNSFRAAEDEGLINGPHPAN